MYSIHIQIMLCIIVLGLGIKGPIEYRITHISLKYLTKYKCQYSSNIKIFNFLCSLSQRNINYNRDYVFCNYIGILQVDFIIFFSLTVWGVPNPVCLVRNGACRVFRKTIQIALTAAEKVVRSSVVFLHVANAALWVAKTAAKAAKATLDVAKRILSAVNWTYRFAMKAASWIIKFALTGLIKIHRVYFDLNIGLMKSGYFTAGIDVTFFRKLRVNTKIHFNIKCILCIAKEFAKRMGKGISKLFG